jgi:hypothetical protein
MKITTIITIITTTILTITMTILTITITITITTDLVFPVFLRLCATELQSAQLCVCVYVCV